MNNIKYFKFEKGKFLYFGDNDKRIYYKYINDNWVNASIEVMDALVGYDDSEPVGSPYRYGSGSSILTRVYLEKSEAEKMIGIKIDEEELNKLL